MSDDTTPSIASDAILTPEALLASRLREAREFLGLSQEVVAEAMEMPRSAVSAIEGMKRAVSAVELQQFAALYRRPLEFFTSAEKSPGDESVAALFRATSGLTDGDKQQVLRFAEFLQQSGGPPDRSKE